MSVETSDLEVRLRDDLPRLAAALLDGAIGTAEPAAPVAIAPIAPRRSPRRRAIAVAALAAVVVVGAALVIAREVQSRRDASSPFAAGLGQPVALPSPPLLSRSTPVLVWTGRSLLVWGGQRGDAKAPLALRDGATLTDGGRWEPTTQNQWGHPGGVGTWAGDRLVVLAKNGGASYDAFGTKTWTDLPRLPDEHGGFRAVATVNGHVYGLVTSTADTIGIARLDDADRGWSIGATTSRGSTASGFSLVPDGRGLDLWADGVRRAHYDPDRDAWQDGDNVTVPSGFDTPHVVGVGASVAVVDAGGARGPALFDPSSGTWTDLTGGEATVSAGSTMVSAGDRLVVWGGERNPGVWAWTLPTG